MPEQCATRGCEKEARAAISTSRPTRDNIYTRVWWDDRSSAVPKKSERHCKEHTIATLNGLADVLVDLDDEVGADA